MDESFERLGSSWAEPPGPITPPSLSLTPSEINVAAPFRPGDVFANLSHPSSEDTPSVAPNTNPATASSFASNDNDEGKSSKQARLAALAAAQARRDHARKEISRLRTVMEEAYDEEEAGAAIEEMNANPAEFLASRRPLFRKAAAAIKDEKEAAEQIAQVEQELRDLSMSPQDMLVEVRGLIRKQNAAFETMRAENEGLQARVATLEAVLRMVVSLPQISQSAADVCAFAKTEVEHKALQGCPAMRTLLQHATEEHDALVIDYLLGMRSTLEERALVLLNPPEESRKYEIPKQTNESSVLGQQAMWAPYKSTPNQQKGWVQIDAGRQVSLMGWQMETEHGVQCPKERSFLLDVSNDGENWMRIPTEMDWQRFQRYALPVFKQYLTHHAQNMDVCRDSLINNEFIAHANQFHLAQGCIAFARYFRLIPNENGWNNDRQRLRFGLLIIDDDGDYLVGRRFVRDLSPLHKAAKAGDTELIRKLLDHGADPELLAGIWKPPNDSPIAGGKTALQLAASSASLEAVQMLVDRGAKVDEHDFEVPKGKHGDLVAGFLQTNGSKPVMRTAGAGVFVS